jgi:ribosomal protein L3 glutamine methyltransferase
MQALANEAVEELQTVNDLLRWGVTQFNGSDIYFGHGTDNPWDECLSLICFVLNLSPRINPDILSARTTKSERAHIVALICERIETKKPAAYLTNQAYFVDLPFYVNEDVLVPRSPIGELIKSRFEGLLANSPVRIMDLCTGSGCIAIACAYAFEDAEVDALDISPEALAVADENIHRLGVAQRVIPIHSDVFSGVAGQCYDLIVSNPPYVDAEDIADMPEEFHHEPEIGLGSGSDGLDITRVILREAAQHLNENGTLIVEVGNSMIHLQQEFPQVPFNWIEFEHGGLGVFSLTREQLLEHQELFN